MTLKLFIGKRSCPNRGRDSPRLTQFLWSAGFGASGILRMSELSVPMVTCICVYDGCQMKSKLQHNGT
jgi:hypothetical protein